MHSFLKAFLVLMKLSIVSFRLFYNFACRGKEIF